MARIMRKKNGWQAESLLSDDEAVSKLREGVLSGTIRGDFANSLAMQSMKKKGLSDAQLNWVHILVFESAQPKPEPKAAVPVPNITKALMTAKEHLQQPGFQIRGLKVKVTGATSKRPGDAAFTRGGYGSDFFGWLDTRKGEWSPGAKATPEVVARVLSLEADVAGTVAAEGRLSGHCCFCMSELTDPRSTEVGYGPICASHYGMPWGSEKKEAA
jgi:hypothetical protein